MKTNKGSQNREINWVDIYRGVPLVGVTETYKSEVKDHFDCLSCKDPQG